MDGGASPRVRGARWWWAWTAAAAALLVLMLYLFYAYPHRGLGPKQPIAFSHRVHAGVKRIHCRFCHPWVDRSARAGLPPMVKCFYCHNHVIPLHPELQRERKFLAEGRPVPWVRVFFAPDFVKFRHEPHIRWAKLACAECHGRVAAMDRLVPVDFEMGFCVGCHRTRGAPLDCWLSCHH